MVFAWIDQYPTQLMDNGVLGLQLSPTVPEHVAWVSDIEHVLVTIPRKSP